MRFRRVLISCSGVLLILVGPGAARSQAPVTAQEPVKRTDLNTAKSVPFINVKDYGAIADGSSHPLKSAYSSLAAARTVYPAATSLAQEVDYLALKAASNAALGADGAEHGTAASGLNKPIFLPAGTYVLGDDTWTIRNAVGIHIYGAGRLATKLTSNNTVFRTDGLWYSQIEGIAFETLTKTATVALDIDGNVPGHAYSTRGVQGNTFKDLFIDGGGSSFGFALCRQGQSSGQCSENLYLNLHLNNASFAPYYQYGYNALNNTFIGGNFQNYPKHGIYLVAGSITLFSVGFQSTYQYAQVLNEGWDISAASAGVNDSIVVIGCRTESLRFYNGAWSQTATIAGVTQNVSVVAWTPNTAYTLNQVVAPTGSGKLYRVTTAGTGSAREPKWPAGGTVTDGSVVWTMTDVDVINIASGSCTNCNIAIGHITQPLAGAATREVADDYTAMTGDEFLLVDATRKNVTINLPTSAAGKSYTIKKWDTTAHTVTVHYAGVGNGIELSGDLVIPGGSRGYVTLKNAGGGNLSGAFWIVGKSF